MSDSDPSEPADILHNWDHWVPILLRDKLRCVYCGLDGSNDVHVFRQLVNSGLDHLVPKTAPGAPGTDDVNNLVTCCWPCNRWKSDFDPRDCDATGARMSTSRERMIRNVKEHLQTKDWSYYEDCLKAFKARSKSP